MEDILVSIVIPVYNTEEYLPRCLSSVLGQSYVNFEVILVDDGSSDLSGEICELGATQDSRIKVIHQENGGVSSAKNAGLKSAVGEFITFIDSDDTIAQNHIASMMKVVHDSVDIVCSPLFFDIQNEDLLVLEKTEALKKIIYEKKYNYGWSNANKLYRCSLLADLQFNTDEIVGEDFSFTWRAFLNARLVAFVGQKTYNYMSSSTSVMRSAYNERHHSTLLSSERFIEYAQASVPELLETAYYYKASRLYRLLVIMFYRGSTSTMQDEYITALKELCWSVIRNHNAPLTFKLKVLLQSYFPGAMRVGRAIAQHMSL